MDNIFIDIDNFLKSFSKKNIKIVQDGFLKCEFEIKELQSSVEYEILNISDVKSNNSLKINLNQIYKIQNCNREIKLFLDNDTIVILSANKRSN